jgi:3-methyladenine DNA glycosylase AlkD
MSTSTFLRIRRDLAALGNPSDAAFLRRFFKTAPGEYGAGDRFRGIRVPVLRRLARQHRELPRAALLRLLRSPWHEDRLVALLLLIQRFERADPAARRRIFQTYLRHAPCVNNWDLVDLSAPPIAGAWTFAHGLAPLRRLARSPLLWARRIAIVATLFHIRQGQSAPTLELAEQLLTDPEDLLHKATGWMLREMGKRDPKGLRGFLDRHARRMPRTMLRYAIERFPEAERRRILGCPSHGAPAAGAPPARFG